MPDRTSSDCASIGRNWCESPVDFGVGCKSALRTASCATAPVALVATSVNEARLGGGCSRAGNASHRKGESASGADRCVTVLSVIMHGNSRVDTTPNVTTDVNDETCTLKFQKKRERKRERDRDRETAETAETQKIATMSHKVNVRCDHNNGSQKKGAE